MSQLVRFARACSQVADFNERNLMIAKKLLNQGYLFHKLRKTFSKFYHRNKDILQKYKTNLKRFLNDWVSHPEFRNDVIYKMRKIKKLWSFPGHTYQNNRKIPKTRLPPGCFAAVYMYGDRPFYSRPISCSFTCATTWRNITLWSLWAKSLFQRDALSGMLVILLFLS